MPIGSRRSLPASCKGRQCVASIPMRSSPPTTGIELTGGFRNENRREAQRRKTSLLHLRVPLVQWSVISLRRLARVGMALACRSHVHQEGPGRRTRPSEPACQRRHSTGRSDALHQPRRRTRFLSPFNVTKKRKRCSCSALRRK